MLGQPAGTPRTGSLHPYRLGTHLLDVARLFFGEARSLCCQHHRTLAPGVKGENVATLLLSMARPGHRGRRVGLRQDPLEPGVRNASADAGVRGSPRGSSSLRGLPHSPDDGEGHPGAASRPAALLLANPAYDIAHASLVDCNADLLAALRGDASGETRGEDNLKTIELVFAAYASAKAARSFISNHGGHFMKYKLPAILLGVWAALCLPLAVSPTPAALPVASANPD